MGKRVWRWLIWVTFAALLTSGCGVFAAPEKAYAPLRVSWSYWEGDYTLLVAQEMGFFTKYGVEVQPVYYEVYSDTIPDLAGSKIDVGLLSLSSLLTAARLADVKGVMIYDSGGSAYVVAQPEIASIRDLKGKRIGVMLGADGEMFVRDMLKSAGLGIEEVQLVNVEPEIINEKLAAREVDAGYVWAPMHEEAQRQGYKILYAQDELEFFDPDVVAFRQEVLKERPEEVRAFLRAWFDALEYRQSHPQESDAVITKYLGPEALSGADSDVMMYSLGGNRRLFFSDRGPGVIYEAAQEHLDFIIQQGHVTFPPNVHEILDPSFLGQ